MKLSLSLAFSFLNRLIKDCFLFAGFFLISTAVCFCILRPGNVDYRLGTKTIEVPQVLKAGTGRPELIRTSPSH